MRFIRYTLSLMLLSLWALPTAPAMASHDGYNTASSGVCAVVTQQESSDEPDALIPASPKSIAARATQTETTATGGYSTHPRYQSEPRAPPALT